MADRRLQVFHAVAKQLSFTKAAEVLFMTQPAVTFQIKQLEEHFNTRLFDRGHGRISLTPAGELVLTSMPSERLPMRVARITPVSTAEEGRNYFRVEARLERGAERLRPGMKGVGKVQVGERKLIWIWTRYLVDWLRINVFWLMP